LPSGAPVAPQPPTTTTACIPARHTLRTPDKTLDGQDVRRHHHPAEDPTSRADAQAAIDGFGAIDVLITNAASLDAGSFPELTPEQIARQLITSLIGPVNVTDAVLPVVHHQR
jgi:NAD(P)-dependent dehydrogenase (short-subunit alcohol dehydrogenase family)